MTRRKQGLLIMILGATALTLSSPWWLLNPLATAGFVPRLGLQMGAVCVFVGIIWVLLGERKARKTRRRRRSRGLTVVPRIR